jgi:hypothetical protein
MNPVFIFQFLKRPTLYNLQRIWWNRPEYLCWHRCMHGRQDCTARVGIADSMCYDCWMAEQWSEYWYAVRGY